MREQVNLPIARKAILGAFKVINDSRKLGEHPLASLNLVKKGLVSIGRAEGSIGRGIALRSILKSAVTAIKPAGDSINPTQKKWRHFLILKERFLKNIDQESVSNYLQVALSTVKNEQAQALDIIAQWLTEQESKLRLKQQRHSFIPPLTTNYYVNRPIVEKIKREIHQGKSPPIICISGAGGVGKTEAAKVIAHELKDIFNFTLWLIVQDNNPQAILHQFKSHLNLNLDSNEFAFQIGNVKREYSKYKALIVLDDIREMNSETLQYFLMPAPCFTIVTSRNRMLPDIPTGGTFQLTRFTPNEGKELLERSVGKSFIDNYPDETKIILQACRHLPQAIDIVARKLVRWKQDDIPGIMKMTVAKLQNPSAKWLTLKDVYSAFKLSYDDLPLQMQYQIRQLAVFDETGFSAKFCPIVWNERLDKFTTLNILESLVNLSLIQRLDQERFRLHDFMYELLDKELNKHKEVENARRHHVMALIALIQTQSSSYILSQKHLEQELPNISLAVSYAKVLNLDNEIGELKTLFQLISQEKLTDLGYWPLVNILEGG